MQGGYDITESVMVIDSGITAVLAANDKMAIGALQAASEYYPAQNLNSLRVSGYTNERDLNRPYIDSQTLFATVDEQMTAPNAGLWKAVKQVRPQPPMTSLVHNNAIAFLRNTGEAITTCHQPWSFHHLRFDHLLTQMQKRLLWAFLCCSCCYWQAATTSRTRQAF